MTRIVVLFNLKDGVSEKDYEAWARATDLPTVNDLESVSAFSVHRCTSLLGSDAAPPFQYVEVIDVANLQRFGEEVSQETMQKVAGEFRAMADNPVFMLTEDLG